MRLHIFSFVFSMYLFTAAVPSLQAQPYKSIFENTSWSVRISHTTTSNATYSIAGDSIINDVLYKKLYHDLPNHTVQGLLRENTNTGKVWYKSLSDNKERLIMDMNLKLGDTFDISPDGSKKVFADSIYTYNGRKHIQFRYVYAGNGHTHFSFTFIEGIGTSFGLGYKDSLYNFNQYLFCAFKDHNRVYNTPFNAQMFGGDCYSTLSIASINQPPSKDIFVYTDLNRNVLRLTIPGNDKVYPYYIINAIGQVEIQAKSAPNIQQDIDISQLVPGTYIFYLIRDNKRVAVNRFTK